MTFLSTGLLAGLLAMAIPVALHLLARQQPKRVVFPATRFLKASLDTQRDRLKVRRWWLLAMRMFAIAAFAIALARPQIHTATSEAWFIVGAIAFIGLGLLALATVAVVLGKSKPMQYTLAATGLFVLLASAVYGGTTMARAPKASITEATPGAIAIVLDNSIRSSRLISNSFDEGGNASTEAKPMIEWMQAAAEWMIEEQTSDSLIAIVDRSPRPATFSVDHAAALNRIERAEPIAQSIPLSDRVRAAVSLVRSSDLERKSVFIITDLTQPSFDAEQWKSADLTEMLAQEPPITLQFLDLGSATISNESLVQLEVSDATPPRLAKTSLEVTVKSTSSDKTASSKKLNVQLDLYDTTSQVSVGLPVVRDSQVVLPPTRTVDRTAIELASGSAKAILSVPPLEVGTHHGIVRLATTDDFEQDNLNFVTFSVRAPKRLLIVAADREEANVLAGALTAPLAIEDPLAEYRIEISEFLPASSEAWNEFDAVLLVDPASPAPPMRALIDEYLQKGGRLLSFLGPTLTAPDENENVFPDGLVRSWRIPSPGTFFEVIRPAHPAVASLREIAGGVPWSAFRVSQYWQLAPNEMDVVIARYAGTDHAAVIERMAAPGTSEPISNGVHMIVTTPLPALAETTRGWNRLFSGADAWPAFLLVRDIVDSLVNRDQGQHNLFVGESTRLSLRDDSAEAAALQNEETRVQMFPPRGAPIPLVTSGGMLTVSQVAEPGTYWLRSTNRSTGLSVNLASRELNLSRIDPILLDDWLGKDQYLVVRNRDEIRQATGKGQPTRSLYPAILMLLLGAFVLEQVIANRFYATRAAGTKATSGNTTKAAMAS